MRCRQPGPAAAASPCTAPSPELARQSPPNRLASARSSRTSGSVIPSSAARRRDRADRRIPFRARASLNGLAREESSGSISWDRASMPLAAITGRGRPTRRSGSTTATFGSISGLRRLALTPSAGQHGVAGHLRAGTRGGRHGDARQSRFLDRPAGADDLEMIHRIAAAGRQHSGRLGDIQRAAAAEPEHRITAGVGHAVTTSRSRSTDGSSRRRRRRSTMPASASAARTGFGPAGGAAGDHQDPAGPQRRERLGHLADPAGAEPDVGRNREVEAGHGLPAAATSRCRPGEELT